MRKFFESIIGVGKKISEYSWFYPIILLLVGVIAYGLIFTRPGFYWDDWEAVFLFNLHHPAISLQYYAERPFSAIAYLILFPITKMTPMVWQLVALLLRWLGVLLIYCTLNALWPKHIWQNRWIGVLLLVFPGYLNQPVSVAFSQHLMTFVLFSGSIYLMVLAINNQKLFWLCMPLSVLFGLMQIFMMEYFVGLEIIRPIIIWLALQSSNKEKKQIYGKALLLWLPFLIGLGLYVWWRLVYLPTTLIVDPNDPVLLKTILSSPRAGLSILAAKVYQDIGYMLTSVWSNAFALDKLNILSSKIARISWFMGIVMAIPFAYSIRQFYRDESSREDCFFLKMLLLGSVILIAGTLPVWLTDRQISDGKWSDRFALAPMLGAVILVVCLLDWLFRTRNQKQWLFAILLASSISLQIYNTNTFRLDWTQQEDIYWQLHWRVPSLEPGTALFGKGTFTDKSSYYDGIYIVNLLFEGAARQDASYAYFDIYHAALDNYLPGIPLTQTFRGIQFSGNTSQAIVFDFGVRGGCVRVLDSVYKGDPDLNSSVADLFDISDVSNIKTSPDLAPNPDIFGAEPPRTWCYYFEKADLARQMQDWKTILQLKAEADALGYKPDLAAEYLPFIEAYAQTNQWEQAYQLSLTAHEIGSGSGVALCNAWRRFAQFGSSEEMLSYTGKATQEFCTAGNP
jgi:hypothetical protein